MKLVYAVDKISYNDNLHDGVRKKVESHILQFQKEGIEATLCEYVWANGYPQIKVEADTDILYFRRIEPSAKLILKLRQLKKTSPKLRVIMEIPTYPFAKRSGDNALKKVINRFIGLNLLRFYVNRIVIIGEPIEELYHIPTICASNGIDYDAVRIKNDRQLDSLPGGIHVICVSTCAGAHGYERFIEGMGQYYQQKNYSDELSFHIVGEGRCLPEYRRLAEKYHLINKKVFFYGRKVGKELDEIYDKCDIGISGIGTYRTKITLSSSLKAREYAAKGLPIVSDVNLDIYNDKTKPYIMMIPSEDTPVDIEKLVAFYHQIYDNKEKKYVAVKIRETFAPYCDWKYVIKPIIDYIKNV